MKNKLLFVLLVIISAIEFNSCYTYSGYELPKKKRNKEIVGEKNSYVVFFDIVLKENPPSIDLFQMREGKKLISIYCGINKKNEPFSAHTSLEIKDAKYKLKKENGLKDFDNINRHINNYSYSVIRKNGKKELLRLTDEEKQKGYVGSFTFFLNFPELIDPNDLDYIEFNLIITDETGVTYINNIHHDIKTKSIFNIGSTLWEYWSGI